MKILYLVNCSDFFCSHFLRLAIAARDKGNEVIIAAGNNNQEQKIKELGFSFVQYNLSRSGKSIPKEIKSFFEIVKLIKVVNPDLIHMFTIKPIIYGCLASKLHIPFGGPKLIASITGLGSSSLSTDFFGKGLWFCIRHAYKMSFLSEKVKVIFENSDDMKLFLNSNLVPSVRSFLVNGAGVDTQAFSPSPDKYDEFTVVLVARLLKDKGIQEYIEAGKLIRELSIPIRLLLVGSVDVNNPSSMTMDDVNYAHDNGFVEYLGFRSDVSYIYKRCHVACLPSYREGLPKSLIEASSCGLPILTTDVPGCRQLINDNKNGILIPAKNSKVLADSLIFMFQNKEKLDAMGIESRLLAENKFGYDKVIASFFRIYDLEGHIQHE